MVFLCLVTHQTLAVVRHQQALYKFAGLTVMGLCDGLDPES